MVLLVTAADKLIVTAADIARRHRIPELIVGIVLVAFGTSLPELAVSLSAIFKGNASEIVLANVVGSNIVNGLLVIGILALSKTIYIDRTVVRREFLFNIGASLLVFVMVLDHILEKGQDQILGRIDGILLLTYFILFVFQIIKRARDNRMSVETPSPAKHSPMRESFIFILCLLTVIAAGQLTVSGAIGLASTYGLSQTFVGGVIVAIGTSLPELTTSIMALRRKSIDIAVGNVVGSNLFNILGILGLSAVLSPIVVSSRITLDVIFMLLASLILFGLIYVERPNHMLTPPKGVMLVALYAVFLIMSIV